MSQSPITPFSGNFTQQEPIEAAAIAAAVEVLESGRLHRYNTAPGELGAVADLEVAYAQWQGATYCLACASGGYAMTTALRAAGLLHNEPVLTNAFTLAPVPGAIAAAGGQPVFVEIDANLVIDLDDLAAKARSSGARFLLLSHMRGHLVDMEALCQIVDELGLTLVEDCAHTMGASWNGVASGNFGLAGCFSTQTYKHINSGEGGLLTSSDASFMARAIVLSGSYMLYERHAAAPSPDAFADIRLQTPNCSGRMDNLRAAVLIPQISSLESNIRRWNTRHDRLLEGFAAIAGVAVPVRPSAELYVGSSIQFRVPMLDVEQCKNLVAECKKLGVELKWFGDNNPVAFTSNHHSWQYAAEQSLPTTDEVLATLFDMRVPLTFSETDCDQIVAIVEHVVQLETANREAV